MEIVPVNLASTEPVQRREKLSTGNSPRPVGPAVA
jgi:hypothetical protein